MEVLQPQMNNLNISPSNSILSGLDNVNTTATAVAVESTVGTEVTNHNNNDNETVSKVKVKASWTRAVEGVKIPAAGVTKDELKDLVTRSDDVFVCSYPKSGSEAIQRLVQQLYKCQNQQGPLPTLASLEKTSLTQLETISSCRLLQTNHRYKNFPEALQGRIIYVIRSPKGAALELYNSGTYDPTKGSSRNEESTGGLIEGGADNKTRSGFRKFALNFVEGKHLEEEMQYKKHLTEFIFNERKHKVLVLKFEDWHHTPYKVIKLVTDFLNIKLTGISPLTIRSIVDSSNHSKADEGKMLTNWSFIQKSVAGDDFKDFFDTELDRKFRAMLKINWKILQSGEC